MVNNSSGRCKYAKANTNFSFSVKKCSELQPFHHVLFHVTEFRPHFCHTVCRKWRIFKTLCGMSLLKKYAHTLECLCSHTEEEKKKTSTVFKFEPVFSYQQNLCLWIFFIFSVPLFSMRSWEKGPQGPSEVWSSVGIPNGCQMCVRGEHSVCVSC